MPSTCTPTPVIRNSARSSDITNGATAQTLKYSSRDRSLNCFLWKQTGLKFLCKVRFQRKQFPMNRRDLLKAFTVGATMARFGKLGLSKPTVMPKALVFDTFGTVVDWRGSIIEE